MSLRAIGRRIEKTNGQFVGASARARKSKAGVALEAAFARALTDATSSDEESDALIAQVEQEATRRGSFTSALKRWMPRLLRMAATKRAATGGSP